MTVRLVVSDVDGTIVQPDKTLSPGTIAAAARLQAAGIPLALVSARPPRGMAWITEALQLEAPYAGFNGGALIRRDGTVVEWNPAKPDAVQAALQLFAARGVDAWLFTQDEWLVQDAAGAYVEHERNTVRFAARQVDDFAPYVDQVGKLVGVSADLALLAEVERELQGLVGTRATAHRSQRYYLDLTHPDANKGYAVRALARHQGIGVEDVAVLGDMVNDVPMFRVAGFSVAMGNGSDEARQAATATTGANDHEGWAHAIDTLILPPRRMTNLVRPDPASLAQSAAAWIAETLAARPGRLAVALSGGSTPRLLYAALARPPLQELVPWERVHWFWGDERFVPPDDPRSNQAMVRAAMLDHVPAPEANIHPVPTAGLTPAEAAAAYETQLRAFHGEGDAPLFDLVLLGLGTNGHIASLFPGEPVLDERTAWAAPVTPPGEPTRITLTWPPLESCRDAAFLVAGADKRQVVARVRDGDMDLVATRYRPVGALHWWLDAAAAG